MSPRGKGWGAPMPEELRATLRSKGHPARAVACPWCKAKPWATCTTPSKTVRLIQPHPARITAWNRALRDASVCPVPTCLAAPGHPCHDGGTPLPDEELHPERGQLEVTG